MHSTVYIATGSNLGDRCKNIERAVACLNAHASINVVAQSPLYECAAMTVDGRAQPDYLNGVIEICTSLKPLKLLDVLQSIEMELGRKRHHGRWEPRIIDLDIIFYDALIITTHRLTIPHPEMSKRMFVLRPLCDIAPYLKHPVSGKTMTELAKNV